MSVNTVIAFLVASAAAIKKVDAPKIGMALLKDTYTHRRCMCQQDKR